MQLNPLQEESWNTYEIAKLQSCFIKALRDLSNNPHHCLNQYTWKGINNNTKKLFANYSEFIWKLLLYFFKVEDKKYFHGKNAITFNWKQYFPEKTEFSRISCSFNYEKNQNGKICNLFQNQLFFLYSSKPCI